MRPADTGPHSSVATLARESLTHGLAALAGPGSDIPAALRWLNRAHRLVPHDPSTALALASACLAHDPERAAALFRTVAKAYDSRQAWLGTCRGLSAIGRR